MNNLKRLTEKVAIPFIDAAVDLAIPDSDPNKALYKAVWYSVKGAYGFLDSFMPEEAQDFMEQITKNRDKISKELLQSKEFEQSLIITFDALIRTRSKRKRKVIKKIYFKGYLPIQDKESFELERFYTRSQEISVEALEYLRFIKLTILPEYLHYIEKENNLPSNVGKSIKTSWNTPITSYIQKWISANYDMANATVRKKYPNLLSDHVLYGKLQREFSQKKQEYEEMAAELLSLGIFRSAGMAYDGETHTFTKFGLSYVDYLDKEDLGNLGQSSSS